MLALSAGGAYAQTQPSRPAKTAEGGGGGNLPTAGLAEDGGSNAVNPRLASGGSDSAAHLAGAAQPCR